MNTTTRRFGLGLRRQHFDAVLAEAPAVDFFEILTENYLTLGGRARATLEQVAARWPVVMHGVSLSIGSTDPLDLDYLTRLRALADQLDASIVSDHLAYASRGGVHYHELVPLPFTEAVVRHVVERVTRVQELLGRRLTLENPTYYFAAPGAELSEAEFIGEVARRADCLLLLDVNNVWVNAKNHGYDPRAFLRQLPLERVTQVHLAGHDATGEFVIDTHGAPIVPEVLALYRDVLPRVGDVWTVIERDQNVPPLAELVRELSVVRRLAAGEPAWADVNDAGVAA